jgi:hypothetical protein
MINVNRVDPLIASCSLGKPACPPRISDASLNSNRPRNLISFSRKGAEEGMKETQYLA